MSFRLLGLFGLLGALVVIVGPAPAQDKEPRFPAKVDLGPEFGKLGLPPRLQGDRDVCSLFAITAVAEFESNRPNPRARKQFSQEFLIWAANEATGLKDEQAMFFEAVHGLNVLGICTADLMPYEKTWKAGRKPSDRAIEDARERSGRWKAVWIRRWDLSRPLGDEEILAIKKALASGHPVACGLRWPKNLPGAALLEVPAAKDVFDGHSIVFTGYEDDPQKKGGGVFSVRNSFGPDWGRDGYGTMSYAHARAYANDALWLQFGPPNSEVPTERYEVESLGVVSRKRCAVEGQKMDSFGGLMWSGGEQLFCRAGDGGSVEFSFKVSKPGRYRLRILATAAPDFGAVRVAIDGKKCDRDFDLYAGRVCPSGPLELGEYDLAADKHSLRVEVAGKNPSSTNYFFGLDALDLIAVR